MSLNAFYARLTAAKLLRYEWAAALQCENFMKDLENYQEPLWISISLCAAAQYVIYATPDVYYYCKTRAKLGSTFEWDEWKKAFQRARAFPGLSKDAHRYSHLAVAAMEREERGLPKSLQNYMKLVVELHEKSGSKRLLKLKGTDPWKDGTGDRNNLIKFFFFLGVK